MGRSNRKALLAALAPVALALTFGAGSASADTIIYALVTANTALSAVAPGPYATVTVNQTGDTATITFDSLINNGYIYLMGDGGAASVNVNGTYTLGTVTESNSIAGFTPTFSANSPGNADGFGTFSLSLNNTDGFTDSATKISFTITSNTTGTWTSASNVLTGNNQGEIAAAHIFPCAEPGCSTSSTTIATGFASGATVVPIPAAAWLFVSGLIGLIGIARRKLAA